MMTAAIWLAWFGLCVMVERNPDHIMAAIGWVVFSAACILATYAVNK